MLLSEVVGPISFRISPSSSSSYAIPSTVMGPWRQINRPTCSIDPSFPRRSPRCPPPRSAYSAGAFVYLFLFLAWLLELLRYRLIYSYAGWSQDTTLSGCTCSAAAAVIRRSHVKHLFRSEIRISYEVAETPPSLAGRLPKNRSPIMSSMCPMDIYSGVILDITKEYALPSRIWRVG